MEEVKGIVLYNPLNLFLTSSVAGTGHYYPVRPYEAAGSLIGLRMQSALLDRYARRPPLESPSVLKLRTLHGPLHLQSLT
jgi:hypothetical protein